jgi:hypothetical protein
MSSLFSLLLEMLARRRFARPLKPPPLVKLVTSPRRCRLRPRMTPSLHSASVRPTPPFQLRPFSNASPSASRRLARSLSRPSQSLRVGGLSLRARLATCQHRSRFQSPSWLIVSPSLLHLRSLRPRPAELPPRALPRPHRARGPPLASLLSLRSRSMALLCVSVTAVMCTRRLSTTRLLLQLSRATSLCRRLCPHSPRLVARFCLSCSEERRYLPRRGLVRSRSDGLCFQRTLPLSTYPYIFPSFLVV